MQPPSVIVHSEGLRWQLPGPDPWLPGSAGAGAEVVVEQAQLPADLPPRAAAGAAASRERYAVQWPGCLRAEVCAGARVRVQLLRPDPRVLATYLWGPLAAAVLTQRGHAALHASVVRAPGGAVALLGGSGSGKSTLAAALVQRGWPLVGDDLAALGRGAGGEVLVAAGPPRLKLWPEAAGLLGLAHLPQLHPDFAKRVWRAPAVAPASWHPLRALVLVTAEPAWQHRVLDEQAAFAALAANSASSQIGVPSDEAGALRQWADLLRSAPMLRVDGLRGRAWPPARAAGWLAARLQEHL